jgi:hypothetical protein
MRKKCEGVQGQAKGEQDQNKPILVTPNVPPIVSSWVSFHMGQSWLGTWADSHNERVTNVTISDDASRGERNSKPRANPPNTKNADEMPF